MGRAGHWADKAGHKLSHTPFPKLRPFTKALHLGIPMGERELPGPTPFTWDLLLGPGASVSMGWEACLWQPPGALMSNRFVYICFALLCS